jgi:glutaredoxin
VRLTIYSKPECHLCDEMKRVVYRVVAGRPEITVEDVNISGDAELLDRYRLEIPVLMIDGRKVAKYRVSVETLTRLLEGM